MKDPNIGLNGKCLVLDCYVDVKDTIQADDLTKFDVFYWICTSFVLLYGIPLTVGLVHYEKYGGDPQKRSLANRFVSNVCICDMISLIFMVALVINIR